jgi:putative ABC transport system substrate-binding protein
MEPTLLGRRAFLTFLGCALASRPVPSFAQQKTVRTVGVLMGFARDADTQARAKAFEQGLEKEGWTIGEDLRIEYRFSGGDVKRMRAIADEFVKLKPDCLLGQSTPVVEALTHATRSIPIVFVAVTDPIGSKFVASMARPGGNVTGFTIIQPSMTAKYVSMLREIIPQLTRVALMYNPESATGKVFLPSFLDAAKVYKIEATTIRVQNAAEIELGITNLAGKPHVGLIIVPDNFVIVHRELIVSLTARYRIPAIYPYRYFTEAGGLLSYGVDAVDLFRRASVYVSRILRGANPGNLPVQAPTKFELVINLKTAKELGLTIPRVLLAGANAIIQ